MNIYVGNLPYGVNNDELKECFVKFGEVVSANIINDKMSGRSKGFGFVEMIDDSEAIDAIKELNDSDMGGRNIKVNQAKPKESRPGRVRF